MLVLGFDLSPEEALPVLQEWNEQCLPPWTTAELQQKLAAADKLPDDRGWLIRSRERKVEVNICSGDQTVFVGVDCASEDHSFVNLSTMGAAIMKSGQKWELTPELKKLDWEGKHVVLTPPSNIETNKKEVWMEFFLARLLCQKGAHVQSFRILPRDGRRQTFSMAGGEGEFVDPPKESWEAAAQAEAASQRRYETEADRKALPRKKRSPRLQEAIMFVRKNNVTSMTKRIIKRAKREKISTSTLRRAMKACTNIESIDTSCMGIDPSTSPP